MDYHLIVEKIKSLLNENSFWFEMFEHEPVRTSEEASKLRHGYFLKNGIKALIVRAKFKNEGKKFIMVAVPGDSRFSSEKLKKEFGINEVRFATEQEVGEITGGVLPGGVPSFGNLFNLQIFADRKIFNNEKIIFNAGDKRVSIAMFSKDYQKLANPILGDVT